MNSRALGLLSLFYDRLADLQRTMLAVVLTVQISDPDHRDGIRAELVAKYGVEILADPTGTPIGTVVWGVPAAVAAMAAVGIAWFVRRATRVAQANHAVAPADAETSKKLDDELRDMD